MLETKSKPKARRKIIRVEKIKDKSNLDKKNKPFTINKNIAKSRVRVKRPTTVSDIFCT